MALHRALTGASVSHSSFRTQRSVWKRGQAVRLQEPEAGEDHEETVFSDT